MHTTVKLTRNLMSDKVEAVCGDCWKYTPEAIGLNKNVKSILSHPRRLSEEKASQSEK